MLNLAAGFSSVGYNLTRSLRFRASASARLNRTLSSSGSLRAWTFSFWVKRGRLSATQEIFGWLDTGGGNNFQNIISFRPDDTLEFQQYNSISGGYVFIKKTTQVFRDPSAWYHIVCTWDSNNATAEDRARIYVNGNRVTAWSSSTNPTINLDSYINNSAYPLAIGVATPNNTNYFDGYLTEINFVNAQALTPASFGSTNALTGVWQPKAYTGTYGTNGFYLDFEDTSSVAALGTDDSGNSNTWTVNNISLTAGATYDSMTDVPTLTSATAANYAVMNPLSSSTGLTVSNANLTTTYASGTWNVSRSSIGMTSGKWYWEVTAGGANNNFIGIANGSASLTDALGVNSNSAGWNFGGAFHYNGTNVGFGVSWTTGDIIGVAFDADTNVIKFYKNNVVVNSSGNSTFVTGGLYFAAVSQSAGFLNTNFGQRPFAYTPPTGFVALNTFNLPTSTILKGSDNFNIALDTGANIKTNTEALYPSNYLAWVKDRANANNHQLIDTVRGSTAVLQSNADAAETTYSAPSGSSVGWSWKAGGAAVSNTAGTITSQVSANTSAGFSIVTYTGNGTAGATVGHGLGVAPSVVIYKIRSASVLWVSYYKTLGATGFLSWSRNIAFNVDSTVFNNTAPTSSVLTLGTSGGTNSNTNTYVAYCFAPIDGYSAFLEYTGNGSADGTFVYCGFKPKYIMVKRSDSTPEWYIEDASRNSSNPTGLNLYTNLTNAEANDTPIFDFLSNGFKLRTSATALNASGGKYQCMVFAENPFKNSLAR